MAKKKAPDRSADRHKDAGIVLRGTPPDVLAVVDAEAAARGVPRSDVLRDWLARQAAGVCPTCKGSGRKS